MIGIFDTNGLRPAIAIADIVELSVEQKPSGKAVTRKMHVRDGAAFDLLEHEVRDLLWRPVQIIPAEPGTSVVWAYTEEDQGGPEILRQTVIAWALCFDGKVRPMTASEVVESETQGIYVEMPGGKIESTSEFDDPIGFDDAKSMLDHFIKKETKKGASDAA